MSDIIFKLSKKIGFFNRFFRDKNTKIDNEMNGLITQIDSLTNQIKEINRKDGWGNVLAGLGRKQDKTIYTTFLSAPFLDDIMLADLYTGDGLAKKVVSAPADDMTRKWITLEGEDEEIIEKELFRLDTPQKINEAIKWQRLYNGSLIIIGAMDGKDLTKPLRVKEGTQIAWLCPVERSRIHITNSDFVSDPTSPDFGNIEIYTMYVGPAFNEIKVHRSRVLEFFGEPVPSDMTSRDINTEYWGMSVIQYTWNILKICGSVLQGISNILYEFIIGKYKIKGLEEKLAAGNEKLVIQRMDIINMFKSVINAVLLDAEGEDYIRDSASVAGVADLLDRIMMFLSAVSNIPVSRLFGRSPAGMNATGEFDLRNYYDSVAVLQNNLMRKPLQKLIDILSVSYAKGQEYTFKFNPLYELSEKEKVEIEKLEADADHVRIEDGILGAEEVRDIRYPELDSLNKEVPEENEEE